VELLPSDPKRIVEILVRSRGVAVKGDAEVVDAKL
jgi:hypothetical protein